MCAEIDIIKCDIRAREYISLNVAGKALRRNSRVGGILCISSDRYNRRHSVRQEEPLPRVTSVRMVVMKSVYDFKVQDIGEKDFPLDRFKGRCLLIVNTASNCSFTPQYEELEQLYRRYRHRGFVLLAFPSNDFLHQEPGTNEEIKRFVKSEFRVTFPMFSKIRVKGPLAHPLFKWLTDKTANPQYGKLIGWNFEKFLINRHGEVAGRFDSEVKPLSKQITDGVENALSDAENK